MRAEGIFYRGLGDDAERKVESSADAIGLSGRCKKWHGCIICTSHISVLFEMWVVLFILIGE